MLGIILYAKFFLQLIILRSLLFQFVMVLARLLYHISTDPLLYHRFLKIYFCTYNPLDVGSFCNYILLGDFSVNFCNQSHTFYSKLYSIFESFCLSQIVSDDTHLGPNGTTSMIDLIATSSPFLQSCETIPPLANSDHMGLLLQSQWKQTRQHRSGSTRSIWLYKHADWNKAYELIEGTNWDFLLVDDVNTSWEN